MNYTFDLVGVTPKVEFFHQEQALAAEPELLRPAYLAVPGCSLDLVLSSVEEVIQKRSWDLDQAVKSVVQYWLSNKDTVDHWRDRLQAAGNQSLLVGRVADSATLQSEFEVMLGKRFER